MKSKKRVDTRTDEDPYKDVAWTKFTALFFVAIGVVIIVLVLAVYGAWRLLA